MHGLSTKGSMDLSNSIFREDMDLAKNAAFPRDQPICD